MDHGRDSAYNKICWAVCKVFAFISLNVYLYGEKVALEDSNNGLLKFRDLNSCGVFFIFFKLLLCKQINKLLSE